MSPEHAAKADEHWLTAEEIGVRLSPPRQKRAVLIWFEDPACEARVEKRGRREVKTARLSTVRAYLVARGLDARVVDPVKAERDESKDLFASAVSDAVERRMQLTRPTDLATLTEWVNTAIADLRKLVPTQSADAGEADRWAAALDKCQRAVRMLDAHAFELQKRRGEWISLADHRAMMTRAAQDYVGDIEALAAAQGRELPAAIEPYIDSGRRDEARRVLAAKVAEVAGQVRAKRAGMMKAAGQAGGAAA